MQKKNLKNLNKNKILFLDRDGVINFDKGYLYKYEDLEYIPGIFDLCLYLTKKLKFKIIIITNQSGIGRGFYSEEKFHRLMKKIINDFKKRIENSNKLNKEILEKHLKELIDIHKTNFKGVGQPMRIALTGSKFGPGIYDIILSLNKDEVLKRLTKYA